jgi:hypothetical protein
MLAQSSQYNELSLLIKLKLHVVAIVPTTQRMEHVGTSSMCALDDSTIFGLLANKAR